MVVSMSARNESDAVVDAGYSIDEGGEWRFRRVYAVPCPMTISFQSGR